MSGKDAKFTSKRSAFNRTNDAFMELVKSRMSMDIEVAIKTTSGMPVKTGGMKAEVRHFKNENGDWRTEAGKEYSATQEAGRRMTGKGAPTKKFDNYTTAGTSAGWFHRAIASVLRVRDTYIEEASKAVGLK